MPESRRRQDIVSAARRQAEEKAAASLRNARMSTFRKHKDGTYAARKAIRSSGQVVIPKPIVLRWGGEGTPVLVLDLEWAALVVPEEQAHNLLKDLGL